MAQPLLPPVLIGPILRRVEPRSVSVFVATSKAAAVELLVYDGVVDAANPPAVHVSANLRTTTFAANFHATVVRAAIADAAVLLPGHRYSYDLRVTLDGGAAQSLKDLGLLSDSELPAYFTGPDDPTDPDQRTAPIDVAAVSYADGQLPSFVTCPDMLDELVLAHASCRKPHGPGNAALQYVDDLIDDLHGADVGRPHMLFLTGDQIYADDVAAALLPGLNTLALALMSSDDSHVEQVPSPASAGGPFDVKSAVFPPAFRAKLAAAAGFTSEDAATHLLGFGEWLAMYCIAWNPQLWPVLAVADISAAALPAPLAARHVDDAAHSPPDAPRALGRPGAGAPATLITPLYEAPAPNRAALVRTFESFLEDKSLLLAFRREVSKVRRLLANVPTYMIADDHEVSDDWFMTGAIRNNTLGNRLGLVMTRNALAAYTVCQAWGDDPVRWATEPNHQALLTGIAGMFGPGWAGGLPVASATTAIDRALGLSPGGTPQFDFSFTVDGPVHRVRVLDTRTRRQYLTQFASPGLLAPDALDQQLPVEDLPTGHVLVVVSPAPVFGPAVMNELGGILAANEHDVTSLARSTTKRALSQNLTGLPNGTPLGTQFYDAEHWSAQPAAFERLLARLSHFPRVVVLGGDVHYGAAFAMDWAGAGRLSRIIHFTSSAACNAWKGVVRNLMSLNGMSVGLQRIGMPMTRLGWSATLPEVVGDLGNEPPLPRIRVQTGPVILSDEFFRHRHTLTRPPEWIWRANPVVDTRAPADRPAAARSVGLDTDLPAGAAGVHGYGALAAAHVNGLDSVAIARGLQFLNNAGVIAFSSAADGIRVRQSLYSLRPRTVPNERANAYIVHETLLEPLPIAVPTTVGPGG